MTSATSATPACGQAAVQKRAVRTLVISQALSGIAMTAGIAVAVLLAEQILGSATFAGLAQTAQTVGAAAGAYVLARVMGAKGRRVGLAIGYSIGGVGTGLCVVAGVVQSFTVLLAGTFALGWAIAASSQARFAATDLAVPNQRARALALVVWATTVGAVIGPNLTGPGAVVARWLHLPEITGIFVLALAAMTVGTTVLWVFLRPDPLLLAREHAAARGEDTTSRPGLRRTWSVISAHPRAIAAILAITMAHAVMVSVMVMTPLHMHHGGAGLELIGFVISVHILGMFALAPLVGWITDRIGRPAMLVTGAGILLTSVLLAGNAPQGHSTGLTIGLFLLGLGWSCCLIASSALLVDAVPLSDAPAAQGLSDLLMWVFAAAAGAGAGAVVAFWGYGVLNIAAGVLALIVLGAAALARGERSIRLTAQG